MRLNDKKDLCQNEITFRGLEVKNLSFSYGQKPIFRNFSASFKEGKRTAIMAGSGAGKTTLLRLIAGLLVPSEGQIAYPVPNPRFSLVFQENRLLERASVTRNLHLVNPTLSTEQIRTALAQANLPIQYEHKKIRDLSGGEKRRIALLRALLAEYDILLLDEPFTGLDEETKGHLLAYTKASTEGKTVLLVTHSEDEAKSLNCSHILHL